MTWLRAALLGFSLSLSLAACGPETGVGINGRNDMRHAGDGAIDFIDMARNTTSCAGGGSVCSSANPGACDKGTVTCMGTLAMCTPDSTVQDCYEGPPGTLGVGICASGAQSCIGILGPCQGQILPKPREDCSNDLDDDCDGTVNNGCPEGVGIGAPRPVAPYVGASGNANAMDMNVRCPADSFVTGLMIEFQDPQLQVAGLRLTCAKATLNRTGGAYSLSTTTLMPSPYVSLMAAPPAVGTGTPIAANCAGVGMRAIFSTRGSYDSKNNLGGITGFLTKCGMVTPAFDPATNMMSFAAAVTGSEFGYDYGVQISTTSVSWGNCAANEVVVGYNGRVSTCGQVVADPPTPGACLDMLQPVCAPLVAKYKPKP